MNKYEFIDQLILLTDQLADARGVQRCTMLVDMVRRLNALKEGLEKEDKAHEEEKELLKSQLPKPKEPQDGEVTDGGEIHRIDFTGKGES